MKEKHSLKSQPISMFKYHKGKSSLLRQNSLDFMFNYHESKRSLLRQNPSLGFMFNRSLELTQFEYILYTITNLVVW